MSRDMVQTFHEIAILVVLALFALAAGRIVRRVLGFSQLLRDPERLRELLSEEARAALAAAGVDPDRVTLEDLQGSEELQQLVAADLRRRLPRALLGREQPPVATPAPLGRPPAPPPGSEPTLPEPLYTPGNPGLRVGMVVVVLALLAMALYLSGAF